MSIHSADKAPGKVRAPASTVEVTASDLPLHCPTPATPVWSMHPRVFLDVTKTGDILCPYCGTHYVFKGEAPRGH